MQRALDLLVPADQWVDLALARALVQVHGVDRQRIFRRSFLARLVGHAWPGFAVTMREPRQELRSSVRNGGHQVQARDALFLQEMHGVAIAFAVHGHQHMRPLHLRAACAQDVVHGVLDYAQKAQAGLRVPIFFIRLRLAAFGVRGVRFAACDLARRWRRHGRNRGGQEFLKLRAQARQGPAALLDDVGSLGVVEKREQQVFESRKLVATLGGIRQRLAHRLFEFRA